MSYGCTHPLEIQGAGDIRSLSGERHCALEDAPCNITVVNEYQETYTPYAHRGWEFQRWNGCLARNGELCVFNVDRAAVHKNWFKTVGSLKAYFVPIDSDSDGVDDINDVSPENASCTGVGSLAQQQCGFDRYAEANGNQILQGTTGIQYVLLTSTNEVLRYHTTEQRFMPSLRPDLNSLRYITDLQYSARLGGIVWRSNQRLYFLSDTSEQALPTLLFDIDISDAIQRVVLLDDYLLVYSYQSGEHLYSMDGDRVDAEKPETLRSVLDYAWHEASRTLYTYGNDSSQAYISSRIINSDGSQGASTVHFVERKWDSLVPMSLSADGSKILLPNSRVYITAGMSYLFSIAEPISQAVWISSNELTIVVSSLGGQAQHEVLRFDENGVAVERIPLAARPGSLYADTNSITFYMSAAGKPQSLRYLPSDDSDGDGVVNTLDAFPIDPAAAFDRDRDGYPDAWNVGSNASESTTGLTLDSYPDDFGCFLQSHGDGTHCDFASIVPDFLAAHIFQDTNGIVYLQNAREPVLYRWSLDDDEYLAPLSLRKNSALQHATQAERVVYSSTNNSLYISYTDFSISRMQLNSANAFSELGFFNGRIKAMVATDSSLLLSVDASAAFAGEFLSVNLIDGQIIDRSPATVLTNEAKIFFDPLNRRAYYTGWQTHYKQINNDGTFESHVSLASLGIFRTGSFRFSVTSNQAYISYASIYSSTDFTVDYQFESPNQDAEWLGNSLITLRNGADSSDILQWGDSYLTPRFETSIDFSATELLSDFGSVVAVGKQDSAYRIQRLANSDTDGDGMPVWYENANGLSDSNAADGASDADNDGLSNSQEYFLETAANLPDTDQDGIDDGAEVTIHFTNPVVADSDEDGASDGQEINSLSTDPLLRDSDGDRIADGWEALYSLDPLDGSDAADDDDNDGISNFEEYTLNTNPLEVSVLTVQPWAKQRANISNNPFVPVVLNHTEFSPLWSSTTEYLYHFGSEAIAAENQLYLPRWTEDTSGLQIDVLNADTGALNFSHTVTLGNGQLRQFAYHSGKMFLVAGDPLAELGYFNVAGNGSASLGMLENIAYDTRMYPIDDQLVLLPTWGDQLFGPRSTVDGNIVWSARPPHTMLAEGAVDEDAIYTISQDNYLGNVLMKYDRTTGELTNRMHIDKREAGHDIRRSQIVLGNTGFGLVVDQNVLLSFSTETLQANWFRNMGSDHRLVVGGGSVFTIANGALFVLDEYSGSTLWAWSPPDNSSIQSILLTRNYVFLSTGKATYAVDLETQESVWSYPQKGALSYNKGKLFIQDYSLLHTVRLTD